MSQLPNAEDYRKAEYPIEPLLLRRWSPRAMNGEPISDDQILTLFEAARWAPSSFNEQLECECTFADAFSNGPAA